MGGLETCPRFNAAKTPAGKGFLASLAYECDSGNSFSEFAMALASEMTER
jgi:hypothetical protein